MTLKKKINPSILLILIVLIVSSCQKDTSETSKTDSNTLFTLMPSDSTGIDFINSIIHDSQYEGESPIP